MLKFFFNIILISLFLLNILTKPSEQDYDKIAEEYKNNYIKEFKKNVKDYLTKKHIYLNDSVLVSKSEFKEIFKDIMASGDEANVSESFGETYSKLADEFVKDAFPDGVEYVKGSQVHKFFDYENIMDKFNKYIATISQQYKPNPNNVDL